MKIRKMTNGAGGIKPMKTGLGLRPAVEVSLFAYLSSVNASASIVNTHCYLNCLEVTKILIMNLL